MSQRAEHWEAIIRGQRGLRVTLARMGLWWARIPYGVVMAVRQQLYARGFWQAVRVPVPVISVGNLTLGGTGKTPCVEAVARWLREQGHAVTILSRGYGVESGPNDEAMVLEHNLPDVPHLQGRNRIETAMTAIHELESEVLLLDDGFQHQRLHRDLDIVLLDATKPITSEYLFPRGTLREPLSALRRVHVAILTRCEQATLESITTQRDWLAANYPHLCVVEADHQPLELINGEDTQALSTLQGVHVVAFCGLANPEAFRQTLTTLGAEIVDFIRYPDHHPYTRADVEDLAKRMSALPAHGLGVTSQKDFVKLRTANLGGRPLWAVRIGMRFRRGLAELHQELRQRLPEPENDE
jgi:tetraacyldisaccharide 4'-kinase